MPRAIPRTGGLLVTIKKVKRPIERARHGGGECDPVDLAIARRFPHHALRGRIHQATSKLEAALGRRRLLWVKVADLLLELRSLREGEYFDSGFAHGAAAARAAVVRTRPRISDLAARLRDAALQEGRSIEDALPALLHAALALAMPGGQRRTK